MSEGFNISEETYVKNQIEAINGMVVGDNNIYANLNGITYLNKNMQRPRAYNRDSVRRALSNPYDNVTTLQQVSSILKSSNGIYAKILVYNSTMLTNNHMVVPISSGSITSKDKMLKAYEDVSNFVNKYNIKKTSCWIYERVLEQGELYAYKLEGKNQHIIQEFPAQLCKVTALEGNVKRFGINLNGINSDAIMYMPKEIQDAYNLFKSNKLPKDKLIDSSYYQVSDKGVAFTLEKQQSKGVPFYCSIFDDLMELEDMKDLKSETAVIESTKLIHQKLPIDKETGKVLMDMNVAKTYHNATKANMPTGTAITTNPLDLQTLSLADGSTKLDNDISQAMENAFDTAGINSEIFNGKKNSNMAITSGMIVDSLLPKRLQMMVEDWMNFELSTFKKNGTKWKFKFIDSTHFDREERSSKARENMAFGGSRFEFLASQGYEPIEGINLLKAEQLLGLDEIMIPQATSHTLSKSASEDNGRPKTESDEGSGMSTEAEEE